MKRNAIYMLSAIALLLAMITSLNAQSGNGRGEYRQGELVCRMQQGYSISIVNDLFGTIIKGHLPQTDCYLLIVPQNQDAESLAVEISARPEVLYCGLNHFLDAPEPFQRSQPFLDEQLTGDFDLQLAATTLNLPTVHSMATGQGVKVAILDGGANLAHPLFATMPGELISRYDYIDADSIANDEPGGASSGHGTFVAGSLMLVAPGASLYVYRVLDTTGRGTGYDISAAVLQAVDDDCRIINLSLGMTGIDDALDDALRQARMEGVLVVASAGNDSTDLSSLFPFPASRTYCLAVAALDSVNQKADFSNYGLRIDYCAPGTSIYSPFLNESYAWWDGTSFSAPMVAGCAALLLSLDSSLTPDQVDTLLMQSAFNVDLLNPGLEGLLGHGLVQPLQAISELTFFVPGDANDDGDVDVADAVFLINLIFKNGSLPAHPAAADANCDLRINVGDAVYLIRFIYVSGPSPCSAP